MLTTAARTSGHVPDAAARQVEGDLGTDDTALLICRTLWEERTREAALRGGEPQGRGGGSRPATRTTPCLRNPAARFRAYYLKTAYFRWSLCYILVPRYVAHKGRGVGMAGW